MDNRDSVPSRRRQGWWLGAVLLVLGAQLLPGCRPGEEASEDRPRRQVFSEHRFLQATQPTKQLGEDCTTYGASECLSGLCLHYKHNPAEGYACSKQCEGDLECPEDWRCTSAHPTPGSEFCVPPSEWSPIITFVPDGGSSQ
jgi:hypothetical protein